MVRVARSSMNSLICPAVTRPRRRAIKRALATPTSGRARVLLPHLESGPAGLRSRVSPRLRSATAAWPRRPARNRASVFMALVDQVFDLQGAERDAFAGCTDMGERLRGCPLPLGNGRLLDGEFFQGAGDNLFGGVLPAGEKMVRPELL